MKDLFIKINFILGCGKQGVAFVNVKKIALVEPRPDVAERARIWIEGVTGGFIDSSDDVDTVMEDIYEFLYS